MKGLAIKNHDTGSSKQYLTSEFNELVGEVTNKKH